MAFEDWLLVIGSVLLLMAIAHPLVRRLPITTALVYLLVGMALGPWWQGVLRIDPVRDSGWLLRAAEISILVSLFTVGMKLRLPVWDRRLRPALCLAFVSMALTAALITAAGVWLLHLPLGAAVVLAGVLAPTDPVLASDVQITDPHDQNKLRLTLTAEGGFNDGTSYPVVMLGLGLLGLHDLGDHGWRWWVIDGAWAVCGGFAVGALIGGLAGRLILRLNARRGFRMLGEYVVLGLIGVSFGVASWLHASGFLAVFAAGLAMRAAEKVETQAREGAEAPAPSTTPPTGHAEGATSPAYFAGALLATNEQMERILEVGLVLVVGAALALAGWSREALWFAPLVFVVIRPLATLPVLLVARFSRFEFGALSWFGIRGIGSIFYLLFALAKGLPPELATRLVSLTFTVVACSVLVHGVSVTPVLRYYGRLVGHK